VKKQRQTAARNSQKKTNANTENSSEIRAKTPQKFAHKGEHAQKRHYKAKRLPYPGGGGQTNLR
jgi:hypothetical protein